MVVCHFQTNMTYRDAVSIRPHEYHQYQIHMSLPKDSHSPKLPCFSLADKCFVVFFFFFPAKPFQFCWVEKLPWFQYLCLIIWKPFHRYKWYPFINLLSTRWSLRLASPLLPFVLYHSMISAESCLHPYALMFFSWHFEYNFSLFVSD